MRYAGKSGSIKFDCDFAVILVRPHEDHSGGVSGPRTNGDTPESSWSRRRGGGPADSRAPGRPCRSTGRPWRMPAFLFCDSTATRRRAKSGAPVQPHAGGPRRCRLLRRAPVGAAVAARSWTAASRLLAMAEAAQNLRGIGCRAPDTGEDALALAINAEQPADEAVLRRLLRQRLLHCGCRCCCRCAPAWRRLLRQGLLPAGSGQTRQEHPCTWQPQRQQLDVLDVVLEELEATLELLEQRRHLAEQGQSQAPVDADSGAAQANQAAKAEPDSRRGWAAAAVAPGEPDGGAELTRQTQRAGRRCTGWRADRLRLRPARNCATSLRAGACCPDWEARQASGRGLSPLAAAAEALARWNPAELLLTGGLAQWLRHGPPDASVRSLLGRHTPAPSEAAGRHAAQRSAPLGSRAGAATNATALRTAGLLLTGGLGKAAAGADGAAGKTGCPAWGPVLRAPPACAVAAAAPAGAAELAALLEADG
uniref:RibD_C domain-containing protein n=1 Tax=Macrostomum lignano TaxID=282301 RepID=A0A1I8F9F2_9PLAT